MFMESYVIKGTVFHNGIAIDPADTASLQGAVAAFLDYLKKIDKQIVLCSHNLSFDGPKIIRAVGMANSFEMFSSIDIAMGDIENYQKIEKC